MNPRRLAVKPTGDAAFELLMRRGVPVPSSDTAIMYAAVKTDASRTAACVVAPFRSASDAQAYVDSAGWAHYQVAPFRLHPSWAAPGRP